jgi:tartrate-resistant acid phosphatase type 5
MKNHFLSIFCLILFISSCKMNKTSIKGLQIQEEDSFNFLVVGDWGRNGDFHQKDVAIQMDKVAKIIDPDFIISTGDNFYESGVASINDPMWERSFENVYNGGGLVQQWFVVLGNHDYGGSTQAQIDYSNKSRRWRMPDHYFTISRKIDKQTQARFVFIDTCPLVEKYREESDKYPDIVKQNPQKQLAWIDSVLAQSEEKYKFVIGHHPVYSTGESHGDTPELIEKLKPILEKHQVTAYFCGHDHDLQHQKMNNSEVEYFVSGAGSDVRKGVTLRETTKFAEAIQGFAAVSIQSKELKLQFIDYKGNVIYTFSKNL